MSILRRNLSLRSRQMGMATAGSKDDSVAQIEIQRRAKVVILAALSERDAHTRHRRFTRSAKVTDALLFWSGARRGSLRFYGHEVDE
jgi:hypothetical protein